MYMNEGGGVDGRNNDPHLLGGTLWCQRRINMVCVMSALICFFCSICFLILGDDLLCHEVVCKFVIENDVLTTCESEEVGVPSLRLFLFVSIGFLLLFDEVVMIFFF